MKLKLKLINERPNHRSRRIVEGGSGKPYTFSREENLYTYECDANSPDKLQAVLDDLLSSKAAIGIVVDEDAFHAMTAQPRKPISGFKVPNYQSLSLDELRDVCATLGIKSDGRSTEQGLKERLDVYYKAQSDFFGTYDVHVSPGCHDLEAIADKGDRPEPLQEIPDQPDAVVSTPATLTEESPEVPAFTDKELRAKIEDMQNKEMLVDWVRQLTGEELDPSKSRKILNVQAFTLVRETAPLAVE